MLFTILHVTCKHCGVIKTPSDFYPYAKSKCKACHSKAVAEWQHKNPERVRALQKKWRRENPERCRAHDRKSYRRRAKNPEFLEKARASKAKYRDESAEKYRASRDRENAKRRARWASDAEYRRKETERKKQTENKRPQNIEKIKLQNRQYYKRRRELHQNVLCDSIRTAIVKALKRRELRKTSNTIDAIGTTIEELVAHIERQWLPGMTWENYGNPNGDQSKCWHLEHIQPLSSFNITGMDCPEFRAAWALPNLRPCWAKENLQKGTKRFFLV